MHKDRITFRKISLPSFSTLTLTQNNKFVLLIMELTHVHQSIICTKGVGLVSAIQAALTCGVVFTFF